MLIVIGAGPAGLTAAYYLHRRGLPYRVLERHAIGYAWRNHYDSLHLNTLKQVSALPGLPMPDAYPDFPSAAQFVAYLESYAAHFDLHLETGVEVRQAHAEGAGWRLETNRGDYQAEALIVATGIWSTPFTPSIAGMETFAGEITLACDYRNPAPFRGKRTLVVGLGNSGADIAVELAQAGVEVEVSIRDGAYFIEKASTAEGVLAWSARYQALPPQVAEQELRQEMQTFAELGIPGPTASPLQRNAVVGFKFPEAVKAGQITLHPCIQAFRDDRVCFVDDVCARFDAVILATGYRPTLQCVAPYLECDRRGYPQLRGYCSTKTPRLYCFGFDYPVTEGFLQSLPRRGAALIETIVAECNFTPAPA